MGPGCEPKPLYLLRLSKLTNPTKSSPPMRAPVNYFLIPLAALAGIAAIYAFSYGEKYAWLVVPPVVLMGGVFSLKPQINWWYWTRVGSPDLPTTYAPILERFASYRALTLEDKREFRRRTFLLRQRIQFIGKGIETVTEDIEYMAAASAAAVTFGRRDFELTGFDTVVFYPHQFPTPQHEALHASELYVPDGTLIFTLNFFVRSVMEPRSYPQLGLYEFAKAYQQVYPGRRLPRLNWEQVQDISNFSAAKVKEFIGLPEIDLAALGVTLYLTHGEIMAQKYPNDYQAYGVALRPAQDEQT